MQILFPFSAIQIGPQASNFVQKTESHEQPARYKLTKGILHEFARINTLYSKPLYPIDYEEEKNNIDDFLDKYFSNISSSPEFLQDLDLLVSTNIFSRRVLDLENFTQNQESREKVFKELITDGISELIANKYSRRNVVHPGYIIDNLDYLNIGNRSKSFIPKLVLDLYNPDIQLLPEIFIHSLINEPINLRTMVAEEVLAGKLDALILIKLFNMPSANSFFDVRNKINQENKVFDIWSKKLNPVQKKTFLLSLINQVFKDSQRDSDLSCFLQSETFINIFSSLSQEDMYKTTIQAIDMLFSKNEIIATDKVISFTEHSLKSMILKLNSQNRIQALSHMFKLYEANIAPDLPFIPSKRLEVFGGAFNGYYPNDKEPREAKPYEYINHMILENNLCSKIEAIFANSKESGLSIPNSLIFAIYQTNARNYHSLLLKNSKKIEEMENLIRDKKFFIPTELKPEAKHSGISESSQIIAKKLLEMMQATNNIDAFKILHPLFIRVITDKLDENIDKSIYECVFNVADKFVTNETGGRKEIRYAVNKFAKFYQSILCINNLEKDLRTRILQDLNTQIDTKSIFKSNDLDELRAKIHDSFINNLSYLSVSLNQKEIEDIKSHIRNNGKAWKHQNLLFDLFTNHAFQKTEFGKQALEQYVLKLTRSEISADHFTKINRYQFANRFQRNWFCKRGLDKKIQENYKVPINIKRKGDLKDAVQNIIFNFLTHLRIKDHENLNAALKKFEIPNINHNRFKNLVLEIVGETENTKNLNLEKIQNWISKFEEFSNSTQFKELVDYDQALENLKDLKKLISQKDFNLDSSLNFEISESPYDFVQAALEPIATCQRIDQQTGYNVNGESVSRAAQGQFFLAMATGDKTAAFDRSIHSRAVCEIGTNTIDGEKILMIERIHSNGKINNLDFIDQIIDWAKSTGDIRYIVSSDYSINKHFDYASQIKINFMDEVGTVYRDTPKSRWTNNQYAIDLNKLPTSTEKSILTTIDKTQSYLYRRSPFSVST